MFNNYALSPSEYIEGTKIIHKLDLSKFGNIGCIIGENKIFEKFKNQLTYLQKKTKLTKLTFQGECTLQEINRLIKFCKKTDFIIGTGGGKALDTAKAVAANLNKPIVTIPTSAATCSASSALSAVYHKTGVASHYILHKKAPDLAVVDFAIILKSNTRLLCAGMADALAKYYEAFAYTQGIAKNVFERIALNIAEIIYKTIFKLGTASKNDFKKRKLTKNLKNIIRTNILLASLVGAIGKEGCRACAAHAVNNGFTRIKKMHKFLHGEIVGFGNIIQLKLQKKNNEIKKLIRLYKILNLPTSFNFFNVKLTNKEFNKVIIGICSKKDTLHNMPFKISEQTIKKILINFNVYK